MAISKLNPRHASEGRSIAAVLAERIDYSRNPEKTDGGLLVTGYQCSPETAWQEFAISKQIYTATTGRRRAPDKDVISYLIIQSFESGTITPEEANKLGYKLALEFIGGEHQFIVATHIDKKHIHNHIEFLTAPPWTAPTSSITSRTAIFPCGKLMTGSARSLAFQLLRTQRKKESTMRSGQRKRKARAGRRCCGRL